MALQERELSWHSETMRGDNAETDISGEGTTSTDHLSGLARLVITGPDFPDFPIRTPSKAGLLGHQPQRGGWERRTWLKGGIVRSSRGSSRYSLRYE